MAGMVLVVEGRVFVFSNITARLLWVLLAVLAALTVLFSLIVTPLLDLDPCHLCIAQRLLFMFLTLLAGLIAALGRAGWRRWSARILAPFVPASAGLGAGVAAYQSWLQWQPPESVSCIGGPPSLLERVVEWFGQQVPALFMVTGFCEDDGLALLGLSLANWSFLLFLVILGGALWAMWLDWRALPSRHAQGSAG